MSKLKTDFYPLLLILLSSLPGIEPLFRRGIFTAHDIEANIGRFAAFYLSMKEGHILPSWAGYVANGYGSPVLFFTYLLPYYLQIPIKLLGFSLVDTTKIYILFSFILSAWLMYLFLQQHVQKNAAFIGSLFYVNAPYRISDIYARGSLSEHTAFMLIPLVGLALQALYKNKTWHNAIFLGLALAGLLLSHPFILITSSFFYVFYFIFLCWQKKFHWDGKFILQVALAVVLAAGLSAFLLLPFALESKYVHYNINPLRDAWSNQAVTWKKLLKPEWTFIDITGKLEYQTWQIGLLHILVLVIGWLMVFFKKYHEKKLLILGLVTSFAGIFFQLPDSKIFYAQIPLLQQIQFPWRFMSLTIVGIAIVAASLLNELQKIVRMKQLLLIVVLIGGGLLLLNLPFAKGHGYKEISDQYYFYQLTNNTEGISTTPIWAGDPQTYIRAQLLPQTREPAVIDMIYRSSDKHVYKIKSETENLVIDETFYYPNWRVFVDDKLVPIEFQNPNYRGLITFEIPKGESVVKVIFSDTKVRIVAKAITAASWIIVGLSFAWIYGKKLRQI